jgi:NAD-dependent dihydropyrimidine dehydrogenase PreA subunit
MLVVALPIVALIAGFPTAAATDGMVALMVGAMFALLPWLKLRGRRRYVVFAAFSLAAALFGFGTLLLLGVWSPAHALVLALTCFVAMGVLSIDLAGTTPWYASSINSFHNAPHIELVEERCTGAADCVQVCPRDVLKMNGGRRKVEITKPDQCIQCGACIVQCPKDALRFRYDDGRVVEASTLRTTRLNMLGRRTVQVRR